MQSEMTPENAKIVRNALAAEISYRRMKQWKIFSWSSTLLVGITGGVIALTFEKEKQLDLLSRVLLTLSVLALTAYSWLWCKRNIEFEETTQLELNKIEAILHIPKIHVRWPEWLGYGPTLLLLSAAAVATIWLAPNGIHAASPN